MRYLSLFLILFTAYQVNAQNTVKMSAVKSNDYGVAYSLPKTTIVVTAEYTKTTRKAGEFYQYAERYLNISNPIIEDGVSYTLDKIEATTSGIPDKEKSYLVEFKSNSTAPFLTLSRDGLICAINSDYDLPPKESLNQPLKKVSADISDPQSFLSEEILRAGSTAKQAELIAKKIYLLRESRTDILTGEADNMPPDGDAYKLVISQINEQEKALTSMFTGVEVIEKGSQEFTIVPEEKNITNYVAFRFSQKLGVVAPDNLAGAPIYVSLTNKNPKAEIFLTPKEQKDLEKKFSKGIIYNIPGKATLSVEFNNKNYVNKECDVVQYGTQDVLTPQMFDNNKQPIKIIFFPELGAIKQIIQ